METKTISAEFGIWLDHRQATIITLTRDGTQVDHIQSDVENHVHQTGGTPHGTHDGRAELTLQNRRDEQLKNYYEAIADKIQTAKSIFIFGPGEARIEFLKILSKNKSLNDRVKRVEQSDKMTEKQMIHHVKLFYKIKNKIR